MTTETATDLKVIPATVMTDILQKMETLTAALLAKDPLMPNHLAAIHSTLQQYPETVHLLKDEDISTVIQASQEYTKVKILEETVKKAGTGKKKSGPVDLSEM